MAETLTMIATFSSFQGNCYNCGKPGHMARNCQAKKRDLPRARTGYLGTIGTIMDEEEDMRGM